MTLLPRQNRQMTLKYIRILMHRVCESHIGVNVDRRFWADEFHRKRQTTSHVAIETPFMSFGVTWAQSRKWAFPFAGKGSPDLTFLGPPDLRRCFTGFTMPSFEQADFKPPSTNDDDSNSECSSSYDLGSSSGGESRAAAAAKAGADNKADSLATGEKSVRRSKMLVYTALLLTAAIGTLIYFLMSNEELSTCQQNVRTTFCSSE
jgi:hypothetical protein